MKFKRLLSSFLCAVMLVGTLTIPAFATELKSFKDVAVNRWSHDAIMEMVDLGMFSGTTTPDANGVGTFNPTGTMTRAQYIVVVTRYLFNDELNAMGQGDYWYSNNYDLAVKHGLITKSEFSIDTINNPITRQEMALVAVRTAQAQGETMPTLVGTDRIADYATIGSYYKDYVVKAFSMGLISGYDDKGTFGPTDTLTREQGAMVAYRLVRPDTRNLPEGVEAPGVEISGVSWVEGQSHAKPKAGDVVMKADGTKVTLKNVKVGNTTILGFGQGVDIYTGTTINGRVVKEGNPHWDDSSPFQKCSATGEMYSKNTWQTIANQTNPTNKYVGDYDGEIYQTYWQWDADAYDFNTGENTGRWVWLGEG